MFRIRKVLDHVSSHNRDAIAQVQEILGRQFPLAGRADFDKVPLQLANPLRYAYRSVLFVAENGVGKVKGFAMLLHMPDVGTGLLEFISAAPGRTGGGIGSSLYERVREECRLLKVNGLFFECAVDDPERIRDPATAKQNAARLRFYERYGARPIIGNSYSEPAGPGDQNLYFLVYDDLGSGRPLPRAEGRRAVRAILRRKYGHLMAPKDIEAVVRTFSDDPFRLRPPRYAKKPAGTPAKRPPGAAPIILVVNEGHDIHHVRERGYVEAPVRIPAILEALEKTGLFVRARPKRTGLALIKQVHAPAYVAYLEKACAQLPPGKSIYSQVFPLRNTLRPPRQVEDQVGYYCMDTFTPLNANAYKAARGAVDCAATAARAVRDGARCAYALVRPPGHHAERRAFGGFCYFNSAAVAAHLLGGYGRVALLDIDFHHGNGTQNIFYERSDVLTVSLHGDPRFAYPHFSGFKDETGRGDGQGFNANYPLPEQLAPEQYRKALAAALRRIRRFDPAFLVLGLGLDTAKADPTGTWSNTREDFFAMGRMIGAGRYPTCVVQEGGYRTRTLGANAARFFQGLWEGLSG